VKTVKFKYDGTFKVNRSAQEAFDFLVSPSEFAPLLPYFKELKDLSAEGFTLVMEIGIPQLRGQVEAKVNRVRQPEDAGMQAAYNASGRHSLGMVDSQLAYSVAATADGESEVTWLCESLVSGTLASLAQGILAPLARRNIDQMIKAVQRELNGEAPEQKAGLWARLSGRSKDTSPVG
jgi:carbon monoxide dehydrogenase subunit G